MNGRRRCVVALCALVGYSVGMVAHASTPASWLRDAACIHAHESTDWHRFTDWRGRPSQYSGGFQFDRDTWRAVGGTGLAGNASRAEQTARAYRLWQLRGWQPWKRTAAACGLL